MRGALAPKSPRVLKKKYGLHIEFQDAGDAGLLLQKLSLFPTDVVVGFDQFSILLAREKQKWRKFGSDPEFQAYDRGALAFIYRNGEVRPPTSLSDLVDPRFKNAIAIEDPATSSLWTRVLFLGLRRAGNRGRL